MAIDNENNHEHYVGNNTLDKYSFNFKIFDEEHLTVIVTDDDDEQTILQLGIGYTVNQVSDPDDPGQEVNPQLGFITLLGGNLQTDYKLDIFRNPPQEQITSIRNQGRYFPELHENAFDYLTMLIQYLQTQIDRCFKVDLTNFDFLTNVGQLVPGYLLRVKEDGTGLEFVSPSASQGALPALGEPLSILVTNEDQTEAVFKESEYVGFSTRFNQELNFPNVFEFLDFLADINFAGPLISLSGSSNTLREKGTVVSGITLTAALTKRTDPLFEVRFYAAAGSTLLDTQSAGPGSMNKTFNPAGSFSDNTSFFARVDDDGSSNGGTKQTVQSNTVTYSFVYPYYKGIDVPGKTAAQVGAMSKLVINSTAAYPSASTTTPFTSAGGQVPYFAYPAAYGALTSIIDQNGFETIASWTRTTQNITGLDGNAVSYYIYEFNNLLVAGTYGYRFVR